eukprot:443276-Pleurochrysis_carterae.AAC.1
MTSARAVVRNACRLRTAGDDGPPSRHRSSSLAPREPSRPSSAARRATPAAPAAREPTGACWRVTNSRPRRPRASHRRRASSARHASALRPPAPLCPLPGPGELRPESRPCHQPRSPG